MIVDTISSASPSFVPTRELPRPAERPSDEERASEFRPLDNRRAIDELSLGEPDGIPSLLSSQLRSELSYQSRLKIRQSDNGETTLKFKSRLKFDYQFQSEDGTTVNISAKIKTKLSLTQTDDQSYAFKSRVKIQLSLTQTTVGSGLDPLLSSAGENGQPSSPIASAFQQFASAVDALNNQFAEGGLAGDELIVSLVDAFNELVRAVSDTSPRATKLPPETEEQTPTTPITNTPVADAVPAGAAPQITSLPAADAAVTTAEDRGQLEDQPADAPPTFAAAEQPASAAEPASESDLAAQGAPDGVGEDTLAGPGPLAVNTDEVAAANPSSASRRSVLVELRVKFVQSLSQLVSTFDVPADEDRPSLVQSSLQQVSQLNLRLSIYDQSQLLGAATNGRYVDSRI